MSVDVRCGYWDTLPALGLRGALRRLAWCVSLHLFHFRDGCYSAFHRCFPSSVTDPVHSIAPHEEIRSGFTGVLMFRGRDLVIRSSRFSSSVTSGRPTIDLAS